MRPNHSHLSGDSDADLWKPRHRKSNSDSHYDNSSVDSGYYGSRASTQGLSPRSPRTRRPRDLSVPSRAPRHEHARDPDRRTRKGRADRRHVSSNDSGSASDADADDYDPKAKYYLTLKDDEYQEVSFQGDDGPRDKHIRQISQGREPRTKDRAGSDKGSKSNRGRGRDERSPRDDHTRSPTSPSVNEKSNRSPRHSSRRQSDNEPTRRRRDSYRRTLSPVSSEQSEGWETPTEHARKRTPTASHTRSLGIPNKDANLKSPTSPSSQRKRSDTLSEETEPREGTRQHTVKSRTSSTPSSPSSPRGKLQADAADLNAAWYKTFTKRIIKGVDMAQVKKVGMEAAAVAAIKVAVGTQMPWKQRIPKTIATGLAAAVTDFLVSKSFIKPKGMMGTMFARQIVEIALANLVVNPVSNKVTGKVSDVSGLLGGGKRRR